MFVSYLIHAFFAACGSCEERWRARQQCSRPATLTSRFFLMQPAGAERSVRQRARRQPSVLGQGLRRPLVQVSQKEALKHVRALKAGRISEAEDAVSGFAICHVRLNTQFAVPYSDHDDAASDLIQDTSLICCVANRRCGLCLCSGLGAAGGSFGQPPTWSSLQGGSPHGFRGRSGSFPGPTGALFCSRQQLRLCTPARTQQSLENSAAARRSG